MFGRDNTDRQFAEFCRTGNPDALATVFDRTAARLLRVAVWLTRSRADADDAVQRTFLQAIESRSLFEPGRPALPWLLGLLGNQVKKQRREYARTQVMVGPAVEVAVAEPEAQATCNELGEAVCTARNELGEMYRDVLRLHLEDGLNAKEIAQRLARPAGTVRTQLVRALEQLRDRLPAGFGAQLHAALDVRPSELMRTKRAVLSAAQVGGAVGAAGAAAGKVLLGAKALFAVPIVIASVTWFATSQSWAASGVGVNSASSRAVAKDAELDLAAGLAPTGDADLDELRVWALKSPIEELESH
ncbi:MAG TPA: sigma-70 family RNA polymerase sigma factor, partial [Gemmatimonadaceae bacterium]